LADGIRPVLQVDERSRILVAGQAPGRKVHSTGMPLDDASGERLHSWMGIGAEAFYDSSQVAILPLGFCYPETGKSGDRPRSQLAQPLAAHATSTAPEPPKQHLVQGRPMVYRGNSAGPADAGANGLGALSQCQFMPLLPAHITNSA
jgi:uracil-DNA glycosylase